MVEIETVDVEIECEGLGLRGVLYETPGPTSLVVMCHGIPLSVPDPSDPGYPGLARRLAASGCSTLFVNLRGTGDSEGDFYMGGWYADLKEVVRYAREGLAGRFDGLYIGGFSAGGALSIIYAAEHGGVDGVAAFAAPARLTEVFPRDYCMSFIEGARETGIIKELHFPPTPDWLYDDIEKYDAIDFVSGVSPIPLLIVHGDDDETVPVEQGMALFAAAGEPKEQCLLPGGKHRLRQDPRTLDCFLEWLGRLRSAQD